ncbi:superoxide dismutase [Cryobacterium sp. HLT2-28]|uniref:superoxide dismutase n=1 Tax=Cryobacterium sp. HLT2-28 TaxID=1259146 RepID=UPI00106C9250|nr:superoxide dismutase [Cryobacterium sp. HLT2-28]TFB94020.1 superoxide dismutase [Cryobacterium sp. HLT2-28]
MKGNTAYAGSLVDGTIVTANLRTGQTAPLVAADGDPAVGLKIAGPLLLVAGGPSGELRAYDRRSGAEVAVRHIPEAGFVNDLTVAGGTAYFTDSQRAVIYALPVDGDTVGEPREIPLGGDFALAPPGSFNGNGIAAFDEDTLILGQSADPDGSGSALYLVDVPNGEATRITITGGDVTAADGLLLQGRTLYVVQNRENSIAQFRLSADGTEARFVRTLTDPDFDVPTTIDFGPRGDLYAVNARFGTPGTDSVAYEIVRVQR